MLILFLLGLAVGTALGALIFGRSYLRRLSESDDFEGCAKGFSRELQQKILDRAGKTNNVYGRHACKSALELDELDRTPVARMKYVSRGAVTCYGCGKPTRRFHGCYLFSCLSCGHKFQTFRHLSRDLSGQTALVTGGRTKLGHQIVLKLLRAGCTVVATTRQAQEALEIFSRYPDFASFKLFVHPLDLDTPNLKEKLQELVDFMASKFDHLDILVNCAAQTIRCREKEKLTDKDQNRYGDTANVPLTHKNSWGMTLEDMTQQEMEEVYRINAVAPVLLVQSCLELLSKSTERYVINVHAREGIFGGFKTNKHLHTNMAKAALAMMTRTLWSDHRLKLRIHGCDPGWISVDEYYEEGAPWIVPPLDERDGAARILFPLWKQYRSNWKTRKHYDFLIY